MTEFTKHKIQRIKDISPDIFELVVEKNSLNFIPGDCIIIHTPEGSRPYFIASGVQEPWLRFLIKRTDSKVVEYLYNAKPTERLKLHRTTHSIFPGLIKELKGDILYISSSVGVSPLLSYLSTLPYVTPDIFSVELDNKTHMWLKKSHVVNTGTLKEILIHLKSFEAGNGKKKKIYICGSEELVTKSKDLLKGLIHPKKILTYPFES